MLSPKLVAPLLAAFAVSAAAPAAAQVQVDAQANALKQALADPVAQRFYEQRDWRLAWSAEDRAQLRRALGSAERHGIDAEALLQHLRDGGSPTEQDAAYTQTALAYASALAFGLVDPHKLHGIYTLPGVDADLPDGLAKALQAGRVEAWLAALAPQDRGYAALSRAYMDEVARADRDPHRRIPQGELIRQGDHDPRIPRIAQVLRERGYLEQPVEGDTYTEAMAAAVEALQDDTGIARDGIIGPDVLGRLNSGPSARARTLAVNMERRRWLARRPAATRIDVNIADATLAYYRDGALADERRVIVGRPGHETPLLRAAFERLVANPPWRVPRSIAEAEILPKGRGYMRRHNMYMDDGMVVQRASPSSALGLVKFDLDDPYAIYLHDTPAKSLFDKNERHRSHGCIRVEDAVGFARLIAADSGAAAEFETALSSGDTRSVALDQDIPVRLLYFTAMPNADGSITYRPDVYGWDRALARALGLAREKADQPRVLAAELGP